MTIDVSNVAPSTSFAIGVLRAARLQHALSSGQNLNTTVPTRTSLTEAFQETAAEAVAKALPETLATIDAGL